MPVPKPLRRFVRQHWRRVSRELGVNARPQLTASHVDIKMGELHPRKPPSARQARSLYGGARTAEWRETSTAAQVEHPGVGRKEPLIFINLEKGPKNVFAERPKEQYLAHELGHTANVVACRERGVLPDPQVHEFIAYYYELDYAREHNRPFFNALLKGKLDAQMREAEERGEAMQSQIKGIQLAIELFNTVKAKRDRLEIVRAGLGKDWQEVNIRDLWELLEEMQRKQIKTKRGAVS